MVANPIDQIEGAAMKISQYPNPEGISALMPSEDPSPVVMLNLLKFKANSTHPMQASAECKPIRNTQKRCAGSETGAPIAQLYPCVVHEGAFFVTMTMGRKLMRGENGQRAWIFTSRKKSSIRQRSDQLPSTSPASTPTTAENRL